MTISPEFPEMPRNDPKFYPRWNEGLPRTGLYTSMRYSTCSGRNGRESLNLVKMVRVVKCWKENVDVTNGLFLILKIFGVTCQLKF